MKDPAMMNRGREQSAVSLGSAASTVSMTASLLDTHKLDKVYSRISMFLMPTFVLVVLLNQIDRHNISYAALTMNRDLGFNAAVYGLGSALFFIPMCICQIPSNMILLKVGVPKWLGFLVFGWGVIATCCALIHDPASFYVLRVLLGVFESGAAPAMWFAVSQFYPSERMTRPYMWLTSGVLLSGILGAPLAAGLLSMEGMLGLKGWQWLFILEGVPSVFLGILLAIFLPETPVASKWLTEEQKELFTQDMLRCQATSPPRHALPTNPFKLLKPVVTNSLLPLAIFAGFAVSMAAYAFLFFSAILVAALLKGKAGLTNVAAAAAVGSMELKPILLLCIPSFIAGVAAFAVAAHSQRRDEVYWHSSIPLIIAGVLFMAFPPLGQVSVAAGFFAVIVFSSAVACANGPLLSVVTRVCSGPSQAIGMPYYNSLSMLGGFLGPYLTGTLLQRPGGIKILCIAVGVVLIAAGIAVIILRYLLVRQARAQLATDADSADASIEASMLQGKDVQSQGPPGAVRKDSELDFGVEMTDSRFDKLVHRKDRDDVGMLPPRP